MRILFSSTPLDGHFRPMVPLARALRSRGHDVAVATERGWHAHVEAEGLDALAAGCPHHDAWQGVVDALGDMSSVRADTGQEIFAAWERLPYPTVAAVSGTCLGGGTEWSLASTYLVVSDRKDLRIGLPEIQLGILPAWGGCTRLPRKVGAVAALDIILAGKSIPGRQAAKIGLADASATMASIASPQGSGFITIPAPPPYGVSSTVRWRSRVWSRRSCTRTSSSPEPRALPTSDTSSTSKKAGKIVTTSTRMDSSLGNRVSGV